MQPHKDFVYAAKQHCTPVVMLSTMLHESVLEWMCSSPKASAQALMMLADAVLHTSSEGTNIVAGVLG